MHLNRLITCIAALCCYTGLFSQDLIPVKNEKGKYGYLTPEGTIALKYKFDDAGPFIEGMAKVRKGNKWGYINAEGEQVIPIKYSEMQDWHEGISRVALGGKITDGQLVDAKWGYIDRNGNEVLKIEYDEIGDWLNGNIAYVKKGDKYGYINPKAQFVVPCQYKAVGTPNRFGYFWVNEGGNFKNWEEKDLNVRQDWGGKYGVFNTQGEEIIPCRYKAVGTFLTDEMIRKQNEKLLKNVSDDKAVSTLVNKYSQLLDNKYRQYVYSQIVGYEYASLTNSSVTRSKSKLEILGHDHRPSGVSTTTEYYAANTLLYPFSAFPDYSLSDIERAAIFWASEKFDGSYPAIYNVALKQTLLPENTHEWVSTPTDYVCAIADRVGKSDMTMNYYSTLNKDLLLQENIAANASNSDKAQIWLTNFDYDFAEIREFGTSRLIHISGVADANLYSSISDFRDSLAVVTVGDKYGAIKLQGFNWNLIVPTVYDKVLMPTENFIGVAMNGKSGFLNYDGKEVIPLTYDGVAQFRNGYARVMQGNKWGLIDCTGKVAIPTKWAAVLDVDSVNTRYTWVTNPSDNLYYCYDILQKRQLGNGYADLYTYFNKDNVAFVGQEAEIYTKGEDGTVGLTTQKAIGCVTPTGNIVLPFVFTDLDMAKEGYEILKKSGRMTLTDREIRNMKIYTSPVRNEFQLYDIIPDELWDF